MLIGLSGLKTPDTYTDKKKTTVLVPGENRSLVLKPGDGLLYKGCECPHYVLQDGVMDADEVWGFV